MPEFFLNNKVLLIVTFRFLILNQLVFYFVFEGG